MAERGSGDENRNDLYEMPDDYSQFAIDQEFPTTPFDQDYQLFNDDGDNAVMPDTFETFDAPGPSPSRTVNPAMLERYINDKDQSAVPSPGSGKFTVQFHQDSGKTGMLTDDGWFYELADLPARQVHSGVQAPVLDDAEDVVENVEDAEGDAENHPDSPPMNWAAFLKASLQYNVVPGLDITQLVPQPNTPRSDSPSSAISAGRRRAPPAFSANYRPKPAGPQEFGIWWEQFHSQKPQREHAAYVAYLYARPTWRTAPRQGETAYADPGAPLCTFVPRTPGPGDTPQKCREGWQRSLSRLYDCVCAHPLHTKAVNTKTSNADKLMRQKLYDTWNAAYLAEARQHFVGSSKAPDPLHKRTMGL